MGGGMCFDDFASVTDGLTIIGIVDNASPRLTCSDKLLCLADCPPLRAVDFECGFDSAKAHPITELAIIA